MKELIKSMLLVILLASFSHRGVSQEAVHLESLEEAFELALEVNPDYQNYKLREEQSKYQYKSAKSYKMPTISGTFSTQNNLDLATTPLPGELSGMPGQTVDVQFGQKYNNNAGINISKNVLDLTSKLQASISKVQLEMSKVQTESYEELLKQQVSLYYYSALIAYRSVEINEKDHQLADSLLSLSQDKYDQGVLDLLTVNSSRINSNNVERSIIANRILYNQSINDLKMLFGLSVDQELKLNTELIYDLPEPASIVDLSSDKQLEISNMNLEQSELQFRQQKMSYLPTITMSSYFGQQQFSDDKALSFRGSDWSNYSYLGVNLNIPIFSGFSRTNNYKSSKVALEIAKNEHEMNEKVSANEDLQLVNQYNLSLQDTKISKETFELYESNLDLTLQQYDQGLVRLDQYLRVFEDYIKAESNFLSSMSNTYSYYSQIISRSK